MITCIIIVDIKIKDFLSMSLCNSNNIYIDQLDLLFVSIYILLCSYYYRHFTFVAFMHFSWYLWRCKLKSEWKRKLIFSRLRVYYAGCIMQQRCENRIFSKQDMNDLIYWLFWWLQWRWNFNWWFEWGKIREILMKLANLRETVGCYKSQLLFPFSSLKDLQKWPEIL